MKLGTNLHRFSGAAWDTKAAHARNRPRRLRLEHLEPRQMMAFVPQMLADVNPGEGWSIKGPNDGSGEFAEVGGLVYFSAENGPVARVFKTNGTPGNVQEVFESTPGEQYSAPMHLTNCNGTLYFTAETTKLAKNYGRELWRIDANGARLVADINPGYWGSDGEELTNLNGVLYFTASNGIDGNRLWRYDGTTLTDATPAQFGTNGDLRHLTVFKNALYFSASDKDGHKYFWKFDGKTLTAITPEQGSCPVSTDAKMAVTDDALYFAWEVVRPGITLHQIRKTTGGTSVLVAEFDEDSGLPSSLAQFVAVGARLYFTRRGTTKDELWVCNGPEGLQRVHCLYNGLECDFFGELTLSGSSLFFTAQKPTSEQDCELFVCRGTKTEKLTDLPLRGGPGQLTNAYGGVFFVAGFDGQYSQLGFSDGTVAGTQNVAVPDGILTFTQCLNVVGARLYFGARYVSPNQQDLGCEPWFVQLPPMFSIGDVAVAENGGTATFKVTLAPVSGQKVTVQYTTADKTALANKDYTPRTGTLTFDPKVTSRLVTVPILDDSLDEVNETFKVNLFGAVGAWIKRGSGIATILDNDAPPQVSIGDVTVAENVGSAKLTVTLSAPSGKTVTVNYATADGTAQANKDYTPRTKPLTFYPGVTSQTLTIPILDDKLDEPNETFKVNLSAPVNGTIADGVGICTILDNDPAAKVLTAGSTTQKAGTPAAAFTKNSESSNRSVPPRGVEYRAPEDCYLTSTSSASGLAQQRTKQFSVKAQWAAVDEAICRLLAQS